MKRTSWLVWAIAGTACARAAPGAQDQRTASPAAVPPDLARGARLFDDWVKATAASFVPDKAATPELDGVGGPNGNGTLSSASGGALANTGHDYRVSRLFGPDLRGTHGELARCADRARGLLVPELLTDADDAATWHARLRDGEDGIPSYGAVLDSRALDDLVGFMLAVRDGALPSPAAYFEADPADPCAFVFRASGGDAERGQAFHASHCASCHGARGTNIALGTEGLSLGVFVRTRAPQAWFVILGGKVGTRMPGLLDTDVPHTALARALADLFAAYRDEDHFPEK